MQSQLSRLQHENAALLARIAEKDMKIAAQNAEIDQLKSTLQGVENSIVNARRHLSTFMSASQVDCILQGKSVHRWVDDDIGHALSLRNLSSKAYRLIRNRWNMPLPSLSTIKRRTRQFKVEPGVLLSVLALLKEKASTMTERDRVSVLSFDECSVAQEWCYDKASDHLYSPKKSVQCALVRGLTGSWKQIIYYKFDCPMTKELLFELITHVEAAGFPVVAMVSDMSSTNLALWKSLNVDTTTTHFTNPTDPNREVHVFADVPHLIKLVRNHFLDNGFVTTDGKVIDSTCVRELIIRSKADFKVTHKLSEKHIEVKGPQRMKVKLAAQLLSDTTAKALMYFGEKVLFEGVTWSATSDFVSLIDTWFDVLNSNMLYNKKPARSAFEAADNQIVVLQQMIDTISNLHVRGRNNPLMFQKGIIISSKSLQKLFAMVKDKYNITFLLTSRLNQDVVENLFGYLRQMGGSCDHPSPVSIKYRLRAYLLGKDSSLMGEKYNTLEQSKENCLTSDFRVTTKRNEDVRESVTEALQQELCLTSIFFSACTEEDLINTDDLTEEDIELGGSLEGDTETEGMMYFGGYVARKFPQHQLGYQSQNYKKRKWIDVTARDSSKLVKPSEEFIPKLRKMGKIFKSYHGNNTLQCGKSAMSSLAEHMTHYVDLPTEVITFYVRCRTFFRMRILNNKMKKASMQKKINTKIYKLVA